jgi:hypothetical protein
MELAGDQIDRGIDNRKSQRAVAQRFDHPFFDRRDVIARDRAADHAVGKSEARAAR